MNRLKELREERNWSMRDASKFLGKPYTTYVNHEKGLRGLDDKLLKEYATKYDVSVDYLVGRTDIKKSAIQMDNGFETKRAKAMNLFDTLTEAEMDMMISQLEGIVQHRSSQDSHQ